MKLSEFLNKIYSNQDGSCPTVFVCESTSEFYPDIVQHYDGLIISYKSNYRPEVVLKEEICELEIEEVYCYQNNIYVTVEM